MGVVSRWLTWIKCRKQSWGNGHYSKQAKFQTPYCVLTYLRIRKGIRTWLALLSLTTRTFLPFSFSVRTAVPVAWLQNWAKLSLKLRPLLLLGRQDGLMAMSWLWRQMGIFIPALWSWANHLTFGTQLLCLKKKKKKDEDNNGICFMKIKWINLCQVLRTVPGEKKPLKQM